MLCVEKRIEELSAARALTMRPGQGDVAELVFEECGAVFYRDALLKDQPYRNRDRARCEETVSKFLKQCLFKHSKSQDLTPKV